MADFTKHFLDKRIQTENKNIILACLLKMVGGSVVLNPEDIINLSSPDPTVSIFKDEIGRYHVKLEE